MEMIRRWTRVRKRADTGWEPGQPYVEGALLDEWGPAVGIDGSADLRPEPQVTVCVKCGSLTTYGDGTTCLEDVLTGGSP